MVRSAFLHCHQNLSERPDRCAAVGTLWRNVLQNKSKNPHRYRSTPTVYHSKELKSYIRFEFNSFINEGEWKECSSKPSDPKEELLQRLMTLSINSVLQSRPESVLVGINTNSWLAGIANKLFILLLRNGNKHRIRHKKISRIGRIGKNLVWGRIFTCFLK